MKTSHVSGKLLALFILASSLLFSSCQSISYYGQATSGQLSILFKRQDIQNLLEDQELDPVLREKLQTVVEVRDFAEQRLLLPAEGSYSSYVELDRPFAVWNVFAAEEFSMDPLTWCYPIAGCVSYRGYFSSSSAEKFADKLRVDGMDVYVGGVSAYSTLGWFDDPVLSTVLRREDYQLAGLVFHELAHQQVYAPGDTVFNESFATAVEQIGLQQWLASRYGDTQETAEIRSRIARQEQQREVFVELVTAASLELRALYASGLDINDMREAKQALLEDLRQSHQDQQQLWGGQSPYQRWFSGELNNAKLNTVSAYHDWVPAFQKLYEQSGRDLQVFYQAVAELEALDISARKASLESLVNIVDP